MFNEISAESVTGKPTLTLLIRQFAVYNEEITGPPSFSLFSLYVLRDSLNEKLIIQLMFAITMQSYAPVSLMAWISVSA